MPDPTLEPLLSGVHVWMATQPAHGNTNAGVIIDHDGLTVVDTLMTPSQWEPFAQAVESLEMPLPRLVLTSSHIEWSGGSGRFRYPAVYGSSTASALLEQPVNAEVFRRLFPEHSDELSEPPSARNVSHIVQAPAHLSASSIAVPTQGQLEENLVVVIPELDILFAGAMCSFGVTPAAYDGDPAVWADSLEQLIELAPIVIPGHGPIGGEEEVRSLQAYLRACVAAEGNPNGLGDGPWVEWADRHWDAVNIERAARIAAGDYSPPESLVQLLGFSDLSESFPLEGEDD